MIRVDELPHASGLGGEGADRPEVRAELCLNGAGKRFRGTVRRKVYLSAGGEHLPGGRLVGIGSVKGNIGHTLRSSMTAGVIKAALALYHRVLPPQLPVENAPEAISNLGSSAYLLTQARPWINGDSANPRRAAVTGANFDAVNPIGGAATAGRSAVVILEEEPEDRA